MSGKLNLGVRIVDDHLISVEDAQSGTVFHFAAGKTNGFRYLGIQTDPPQSPPPIPHGSWIAAAEEVAREFAVSEGWI